jgi:hypothetical protein
MRAVLNIHRAKDDITEFHVSGLDEVSGENCSIVVSEISSGRCYSNIKT